MKGIVIYGSKYGHTKEYATHIAKELDYTLSDVKKATKQMLMEHDLIIYGGGIYAGSIYGIKFITKNYSLIKDKVLVIFTCGQADPKLEKSAAEILRGMNRSIDEDILKHSKLFHYRSGIRYDKMRFLDKQMMKMFYKMMEKRKDSLSNEDKVAIGEYGKNVEYCNLGDTLELIQWVKKKEKK